ncbi:MAG: hydrogenase maturation protease [bacterium]
MSRDGPAPPASAPAPAPLLVILCGNPLAGDDAFGSLVARGLEARAPAGVEWVAAALCPAFRAIDLLAGRRAIRVVDAVRWPGVEAGRLIDLGWFEGVRPHLESETVVSTHRLSVALELDLADSLGLLPHDVRLLGVTIGPAGKTGTRPSPAVEQAARWVLRKIEAEAARALSSI